MDRIHRFPILLRALPGLLVSLTVGACGQSADDPMGPDDSEPQPTVMVLGDGGSEIHMTEILEADGVTVVDGGHYSDFTGAGLDSVDAVVVLAAVDYNQAMTPEGEASLVGFVAQGGGLLTTQPVSQAVEPLGLYRVLSTVLPVTTIPGSPMGGVETYSIVGAHPIHEGLPATFSSPEDQYYFLIEAKTDAQVLLLGSEYGPSVVIWDAPGSVVIWNGTADLNRINDDPTNETYNDEMNQLLVNAVRYTADNEREYGPIELERIHFVQRYLTVYEDGDSGDNPGDFYITARLTNQTNDEQTELAGYYEQLQTASPGVQSLGDTVYVTLPKVDGMQFTARVSYYENDGPGSEPVTGDAFAYAYDESRDCWAREFGSDPCVDAEETDDGDVVLDAISGSAVHTELRWQVRVE